MVKGPVGAHPQAATRARVGLAADPLTRVMAGCEVNCRQRLTCHNVSRNRTLADA
jgi:hypothetical protein